jgi:DUF2075 family protein
MTDFKLHQIPFDTRAVSDLSLQSERLSNWPVVYTLNDKESIYVGETTNVEMRMRQHLQNPEKAHLKLATVILDSTFNKSSCLDLESHLISFFAADGKYKVLNANSGLTNSDYYQRLEYREQFNEIFEKLLEKGLLSRSIPEIVNSDLFKYSPFKALNTDQAVAIEGVLEKLAEDLTSESEEPIVIQGDPGTGKTIVAIYLIKLIQDIAMFAEHDAMDIDSLFSEYFTAGFRELFTDLKIALVIPQVSLRTSIKKVFKRTPGLDQAMVMSQFDLGKSDEYFDLVIVDEAHRLQRRANQSSAAQNAEFREINIKLFGKDDISKTQIDWVMVKSKHQIFLLDSAQSVKPADVSAETLKGLVGQAKSAESLFPLLSQMRVTGGTDYINFVRDLLSQSLTGPAPSFGKYDFQFCDDFQTMVQLVRDKESSHGLSRLVAGFAWPWISKNDKNAFDIEIEGIKLRWNSTSKDWISSPSSPSEVGSIHTVQGYDLNYAGVIIGSELGFNKDSGKIIFKRENYFDAKGKENNPTLGITYSDDDLLEYVLNVYRVLLTRGILGTYLYVVDPELRNYLKGTFK